MVFEDLLISEIDTIIVAKWYLTEKKKQEH